MFSRKDLQRLLIPLLLEQLLAVLIGMVDTVMVAASGEAAVSGVSLVDSINVLLINLFSSLATGGAVVTAQYIGCGDKETAGRSSKELFYVSLLVSGVLTSVFLLLRVQLLETLFGTIEPDVMRSAKDYFLFTLMSYPALAMYNASAALLRAMGNSKASLNASIVINLVNVAGNAILIYGCSMGAAGAAIATLVSRVVGAVIMQRALGRPENPLPRPRLTEFEWDRSLVRKIFTVGVPNGLEGSLFQLGKLILLRMISSFGTVSIAANAVCNTVSGFQVITGSSVGLGMVTVVGQCVGAGRYDQARYYTKQLMRTAYLWMFLVNAVTMIGVDLALIPFGLTKATYDLSRQVLLINGFVNIILWAAAFTLPNALRAAGDAKFTMLVSVGSMMSFRVFFGWLLAVHFGMGLLGVWLAMYIDWMCRVVLFVLRFRGHAWERKSLVH